MKITVFILCTSLLCISFASNEDEGEERDQECPENEEYDECIPSCPPQKCSDINPINYKCSSKDKRCEAGCRCIKNYKRNGQGICIPIQKCPPKPCRQNEDLKVCPPMPDCISEDCASEQQLCGYLWDRVCIPRCVCKSGFCRNGKNACVKRK